MKRIFNRFLICILIVMIVSNFTLGTFGSVSYGFEWTVGSYSFDISIGGIIDMIMRGLIVFPLAQLAKGILRIVTALVRIGASAGPTSLEDFLVQPFHILFNKIPMLDVNFLNLNPADVDPNGPVMIFRHSVAGWYYSMRLLASMILAVILIYIGIRMAISTIASEKAMYKKMLVDWTTSLVLLFLLHYIMIFTFACNEALVDALKTAAETPAVTGELSLEEKMTNFINLIYVEIFATGSFMQALAMVIVYGMIIMQTLSFVLSYMKRMFTIGFLIIIAPLITITYSIDKMGDGKSQALNTWLKEFVYNILLQPFQCILYIVFAGNAIDLIRADDVGFSGLAFAIFAILSLQFVKEGEKIVKKIFGFDKASSLADMAAGTAMAYAGMAKGKELGTKAGSAVAGAKNFVASNPQAQKLAGMVKNKTGRVRTAVGNSKPVQTVKNAKNKVKEKVGQKFRTGKKGENSEGSSSGGAGQNTPKKINKRDEKRATELMAKNKDLSREDALKQAKKERLDNSIIRQAGKTALSLGKDTKKLLKDNKNKIIGAGVGLVTMGMGLGAGDFMSIKEGIAGHQIGSGFIEGYFKNSLKTLKSDTQTNIQNISYFTGNIDKDSIMAEAYAIGESDGFKDISKELKDLKQKLSMLGVKNPSAMVGNLSQKILNGEVNQNTLNELVKDVPEENREQAKEALSGYGTLLSQRELYNQMKTAEGMNIDRERLAGMVRIESNTSSNTESVVERESHTENNSSANSEIEIDTTKLANDIISDIETDTNAIQRDIDETNTQIEKLNQMLVNFKAATPEQQQSVMRVLNVSGTVQGEHFTKPEEIEEYLKGRIEEFNTSK